MEKVFVIVNPASRNGHTGMIWQGIREALAGCFHEFKFVFTEKPFQATSIARELLKDGFDLIIGVGGDGTLNEIANGFFGLNAEPINEDAALGIVPSGTGSDFIRSLRLPRDFLKSIKRIKEAQASRIDIGQVTFPGKSNQDSRFFINVADFGLGAEVIKRMSKRGRSRNSFSYLASLLKTLKSYECPELHLKLDQGLEIKGRFLLGAAANGRVFGGGMIIAPDALPDDGLFDLVLIREMPAWQVMVQAGKLYRGTLNRHHRVEVHRVSSFSVKSANPVSTEFDGESGPDLPARFSIRPGAIKIRF